MPPASACQQSQRDSSFLSAVPRRVTTVATGLGLQGIARLDCNAPPSSWTLQVFSRDRELRALVALSSSTEGLWDVRVTEELGTEPQAHVRTGSAEQQELGRPFVNGTSSGWQHGRALAAASCDFSITLAPCSVNDEFPESWVQGGNSVAQKELQILDARHHE
ncbi:hypothetical protein H920_00127 [Fukomys damarensis]|uniref:Uncharacterized protein n=1 Tax=Fukomys damarensis TaxID=885580 RepID=A0A091E6S6_FUKDA|nr:hypothetical protein H920_00127 [Fukomys damarensis]